MLSTIYQDWLQAKEQKTKKFVVLIDPDKMELSKIETLIDLANQAKVDAFFIGGSLMISNKLDPLINKIKELSSIPTVLFPGSSRQLSYQANALLFLSLISGRNAELLIGKHVETSSFLKISPLEIISTGYMLIDGGVPTSVSYMSNTYPIPNTKNDIAVCTALAGELLGLKLIYLEAGSGAKIPVPLSMIKEVSQSIDIPLIVGGGIRTAERAQQAMQAGADILVVGNAIEKDPQLILDIAQAVKSTN